MASHERGSTLFDGRSGVVEAEEAVNGPESSVAVPFGQQRGAALFETKPDRLAQIAQCGWEVDQGALVGERATGDHQAATRFEPFVTAREDIVEAVEQLWRTRACQLRGLRVPGAVLVVRFADLAAGFAAGVGPSVRGLPIRRTRDHEVDLSAYRSGQVTPQPARVPRRTCSSSSGRKRRAKWRLAMVVATQSGSQSTP